MTLLGWLALWAVAAAVLAVLWAAAFGTADDLDDDNDWTGS